MLFQLKVKHNEFSSLTLTSTVNYESKQSHFFNKENNVVRVRSCENKDYQSLRIRYPNIRNWLNSRPLNIQINAVKINPIRYFLSQQNRNSISGEVNLISRTIQIDLSEKGLDEFIENWNRFERIDTNISIKKNDADFYEGIVEKMTSDFYDSYQKENWDFLGKLINGFWKIKKEKYPESRNNYIDKLYSDCRLSGVIGGKMDGSTMILFVHPENHEKIKSIMSDHILLNSSMDISGFVSQEVFSGISNCCE